MSLGGGVVRAATVAAAILVGACARQPSPASDDGSIELRKVVAAEKSLVYTGYKRSIQGEEGDGRATRMKVSRCAAGRTFLEWDQGCGEARRWVYERRYAWLDDPERMLRNYTVTVDPADGPAVAWRETRRLSIRAVRPGRPCLELLVDKETSLVLREELRDFQGKLWLTNVFDTIEYRAPDDPPDAPAEALAATNGGAPPEVRLALGVTCAPVGFVRTGADRAPDGALREDWTDGLAAFSILERTEPPARGAAREGELERRTCSGRSSVTGVFGGIEVTVTGNLGADELESVIRGLSPSR